MIPLRCIVAVAPGRACPDPPASPIGLCRSHLAQAAAEHARLTGTRPAEGDGDRDSRPCAVPFGQLCRRCGSWRHAAAECPTLADAHGSHAA